jgi:hypothetical protein
LKINIKSRKINDSGNAVCYENNGRKYPGAVYEGSGFREG